MSAPERLLSDGPDPAVYDVVVCGAGTAGMAASCYAALTGARVLLIEMTEFVGGTSALSAGGAWIPNTRHSVAAGVEDSFDKASHFLDQAVGNLTSRSMRDAFLRTGSEAIDVIERGTQTQWRVFPRHPDYQYELKGSLVTGRLLEAVPFSTRSLSRADRALIRPPLPEFTIFGGMMVDRDDIPQLLRLHKSPAALLHAAKLMARYLFDLAVYGRTTRSLMGNALIARLLASCRALGVAIASQANVTAIRTTDGKVTAVTAEQNGAPRTVEIRKALILAGGGFAGHPQWRAKFMPAPVPEITPSAPGRTGRLQELAMQLGARHGTNYKQSCFLAPVSTRRRRDGSQAVFPHLVLDRSKPRVIAVNRHGARFVNEATSYHLFASSQFEQNREGDTIPCFLMTDFIGLRKYGLGMVRPGGWGKSRALRDGYLVSGRTLSELAAKLGVDGNGLEQTVDRYNTFAIDGIDRDFGKGETVYHRHNGDPENAPNPCIGPIDRAPYYAVRLYPSDLGSAMGLVTNENAQVLDKAAEPIGGLYAVGNEMHSIMGGIYPAPGINLGPAVVFAYRAARHALGLPVHADAIRASTADLREDA